MYEYTMYIYCNIWADDNLAVEVEATDNEAEDEYEQERLEANLNSPKGQNGMQFQAEDNGAAGMSLNLGAVDDEENGYDDTNVTPNTKRDQMDVNSPRKEKQVHSIVIYIYIHILYIIYQIWTI